MARRPARRRDDGGDTAPEPTPRTRRATQASQHLKVTELATDTQGALSPYGGDGLYPLPVQQVRYRHPRPADRPRLVVDQSR